MSARKKITVGSFPTRCPYCDEVVENHDLQPGVNRIRCEYCRKVYIKIMEPLHEAPSHGKEG